MNKQHDNNLFFCFEKISSFFLVILFLLYAMLTGCTNRCDALKTIDTADLASLSSVKVVIDHTPGRIELSGLRIKLIRDTGLSIGAQGGLAWASQGINKHMEKDGKYLDTIFNFHAMMLSHGVIPPVLVEGDYTLNLADPNTIRVSDRTYKIVKQARFATTAPNWREYLWLSFAKPCLPNKTLLPRTDAEQKIWKDAILIGWGKGVEQAHSIFQQNLARLKRDYKGMILYRKLLQQRMISQPFVSRTEMGITGDGENMNINDQVLRIVELPKLQTNSKCWRPIVVKR